MKPVEYALLFQVPRTCRDDQDRPCLFRERRIRICAGQPARWRGCLKVPINGGRESFESPASRGRARNNCPGAAPRRGAVRSTGRLAVLMRPDGVIWGGYRSLPGRFAPWGNIRDTKKVLQGIPGIPPCLAGCLGQAERNPGYREAGRAGKPSALSDLSAA